jgi:MFS family permease
MQVCDRKEEDPHELLLEYQEEAAPTKPHHDHKNHNETAMLLALCLCTFCNAYLLISPFPYSGYMAIHLVDGLTPETTGFYAGLLSSSFMVGRGCSSYAWGHFSDTYGRQSALLLSMGLSCLLSLLFGLSNSFFWALTSRFLLGT